MLGTDTFGTNRTDTQTHVALYIRISRFTDTDSRLVLLLAADKTHQVLAQDDDESRGDLYTDLSANIVRALIPLSVFSHIYNRPDIAMVKT